MSNPGSDRAHRIAAPMSAMERRTMVRKIYLRPTRYSTKSRRTSGSAKKSLILKVSGAPHLQHSARWLTSGHLRQSTRGLKRHCLLYTSDAADNLLCVDLGG